MEERNIKSTKIIEETTKKLQTKKRDSFHLGIILSLCLIFLVLAIFSIKMLPYCKEKSVDNTPPVYNTEEGISTVNYHYLNIYKPNDNSHTFLTYQVDYPSKYSVFSDEMLYSYITQGGSANPSLTFTLERNPLEINLDTDGILVWAREGRTDIDAWKTLNRIDGITGEEESHKIISEKVIKKKNFDIHKRVLKYESEVFPTYKASIFLPGGYSYLFETNGNILEKDFDTIVESIRIRAFDLEELQY